MVSSQFGDITTTHRCPSAVTNRYISVPLYVGTHHIAGVSACDEVLGLGGCDWEVMDGVDGVVDWWGG